MPEVCANPGGSAVGDGRTSRVLRGEQSNTSIIVDGPDAPAPVIIKLFRVLRPGENPDVVVAAALASGGCERIPRPVGWVGGTWPDPTGAQALHGHLAYACEFIEGSEDAWRSACRAAAAGDSFTAQAEELGATTAEVHDTLAAVLPIVPASPADLLALADTLSARVRWAVSAAPTIGELRNEVEEVFDQIRHIARDPKDPPVFQRIHGDYHLGQVLHSPSRGWVVVDFEGEPLRPLAERTRPDLALRDVAGMLRSFDYAARYETYRLPVAHPAITAADEWAQKMPRRLPPRLPSRRTLPTPATIGGSAYCCVRLRWTRPSTRLSTRPGTGPIGSASRSAPCAVCCGGDLLVGGLA